MLHAQFNGSCTARELKEHMLDVNPDMPRMISRLIKEGFIKIISLEEKTRAKPLFITQKGIDTLAKAHQGFPELLQPINKLSTNEKKELFSLLRKLAHVVEENPLSNDSN